MLYIYVFIHVFVTSMYKFKVNCFSSGRNKTKGALL